MFTNIINALSGEQTQKGGAKKSGHLPHHRQKRTVAPVEKETIRQHKQEEVQPVIEKEVDQTEIQQVILPVEEHKEAVIHHDEIALDAENRTSHDEAGKLEATRKYEEQQAAIAAEHGTRVEEAVGDSEVVTKEPIIHETVNKHVVEEIQPVIERTIDEVHVNHIRQPIYEHHEAAPIVHEPVRRAPVSIDEFHREHEDHQDHHEDLEEAQA